MICQYLYNDKFRKFRGKDGFKVFQAPPLLDTRHCKHLPEEAEQNLVWEESLLSNSSTNLNRQLLHYSSNMWQIEKESLPLKMSSMQIWWLRLMGWCITSSGLVLNITFWPSKSYTLYTPTEVSKLLHSVGQMMLAKSRKYYN